MSQTKAPWSINDYPQPDSSIAIGAQGTPLIARVIFRDVSINEQKANARRIVACVNACEGWSTDFLEAVHVAGLSLIGSKSDILAVRAFNAEKQRDELLAAAKNLRDVKGRFHSEQAFKALVDTVAKVEGKA